MEDVLRRQDVDMGWLVGVDISMTRELGARTPIGASGIAMKILKEDKNGSVDNADLKPEEKKTLRGENHVLRHDKMKYVFEKRRWFMGEYCR